MTKESAKPAAQGAQKSNVGGKSARMAQGFSLTAPLADGPRMFDASNVLQLQRAIGNRAVAQLMAQRSSEATRQAAQATVQRAPAPYKPRREREDGSEAVVGNEGGTVAGNIEAEIRQHRAGGSPLSEMVRRKVEPHLGHDLSQVRTHNDATSANLNRKLGSKAFTHGNSIYYGAGHSPSDIQLTAHEATHVVQQGGADNLQRTPNIQRKLKVGPAKDRYEEEADQVAASVMRSPSVQRSPAGVIQRVKEKISFNGQSKSVKKDDKDEFKAAITKMSTKGVKPNKGNAKAEAILLMGGSGSGKSSMLSQVVANPKNFVHADPDEVKAAMPAYQAGIAAGDTGIAGKVHAESKTVTNAVVDNAISSRRNLIYDGTGANQGEYSNMIGNLRVAGYRIKLVLAHVNVDEALVRVAQREKETGRGIPDSVVKDIHSWVPKNFPALAKLVDQAYLFDNMVPKGQPPKLVWQSNDGSKLDNAAIDTLKAHLTAIGGSDVDDSASIAYDQTKDTRREDFLNKVGAGALKGNYFDDGGSRRWKDDSGSVKMGLSTSRGSLGKIDDSLGAYRQNKSKGRGNAETQGDLLLGLKQLITQSKYQDDSKDKDTRTFKRRKQALDTLWQELLPELRANPNRLAKAASKGDKTKELVSVGFAAKFLGEALPRDFDLLYHAHAALAHKHMNLAQELLDRLNPVERKSDGGIEYREAYVKRTRSNMHFAQQMLTAHHNVKIGGSYGKAFAGKEMSAERLKKTTDKHLHNEALVGKSIKDDVQTGAGKGKQLADLVTDYNTLSPQEIEALRLYTSDDFRKMNATMQDVRIDNQDGEKSSKGWASINRLAVSGLSKLPPHENDYTYRGDSNFGGLVDTVQPGTVFNTPAFLSTTTNRHATIMFGKGVNWLVIAGPRTRGKSLEPLTLKPGENEVLYPAGTKFRVVDVYHRQPNDSPVDGEETPAMVKRLWQSARGIPMLAPAAEYLELLTMMPDRQTLIVVQEVG